MNKRLVVLSIFLSCITAITGVSIAEILIKLNCPLSAISNEILILMFYFAVFIMAVLVLYNTFDKKYGYEATNKKLLTRAIPLSIIILIAALIIGKIITNILNKLDESLCESIIPFLTIMILFLNAATIYNCLID